MFEIRKEQHEAFDQATLAAFENEMVVHSQGFSPRLCEVIGEDQLRVAIRRAMKKADTYGFTNRGPVRLYIELMFLNGSGFDVDPQYPAIAEILKSPEDQMLRSERIFDLVVEYQERVSGKDNINVVKSLKHLSEIARTPISDTRDFDEEIMLDELFSGFPQRAAYIGEEALISLIRGGRHEARKYEFSQWRSESLLIVLMFAFGFGCTDDPLYPWISRTLHDPRIVSSQARARRLETKAMAWLDHVLARTQEGLPT